jgi:hypothetical protein
MVRVRALARRGLRGLADPSWLGSAIELAGLRRAADDGGTDIERVSGEGTQFCIVLTRRRG